MLSLTFIQTDNLQFTAVGEKFSSILVTETHIGSKGRHLQDVLPKVNGLIVLKQNSSTKLVEIGMGVRRMGRGGPR